MTRAAAPAGLVILGRVVGVYGIRGWIKVRSYSRERGDILRYGRWRLRLDREWKEFALLDGRPQGKGLIARLAGPDSPEQARALVGADIAVEREQLPAPPPPMQYWVDLEGLRVVNLRGVELGRVSHLFETGANDVLVVIGARERLIPYISRVVRAVDRAGGVIRVDWDEDF